MQELSKEDLEILKEENWLVECNSPLEIRNEITGCFASGSAAKMVISCLKEEKTKKTFILPNELSKEDLKGYREWLTVGGLKYFIEEYNISDDAKVLIERVEDSYYENNGWSVYLKEGFHSYKDEQGNIDKESMNQYHPAWGCVKYRDEGNDLLFIDMHY